MFLASSHRGTASGILVVLAFAATRNLSAQPSPMPPQPPATPQGPPSLDAPPVPAADATGVQPAPPSREAASVVARPSEPSFSDERPRRWYGWQTLTVDATWVLALGAASIETKGGKNPVAGLVALDYVFGPPVVHFAHGHVGKGFGSMGLRIAPVVIGGLILWSANDELALGAGLVAFFGGVVTAVAVDGAVIAREDVPADETSSVFVRLIPVATLGQNRGTVGVAGAF